MYYKTVVTAIILTGSIIIASCGGDSKNTTEEKKDNTQSTSPEASDPKGIGTVKNVELTHPLDKNMVSTGKSISDVKCMSCHKMTDERLVGPGWKGVTDRRTPEWIMNFIINTEEMIEKDTEAKKMLEVCLVKMPNQGLSETDARAVFEFMRQNDGKQ